MKPCDDDWKVVGQLRTCEWVVYAKRPFAGPAAVLAYLSRYTHRVAISKHSFHYGFKRAGREGRANSIAQLR